MRITKNPAWKFARVPLATAVLATMVSTPTQAVPFTLGDNIEGSFDLTVNAGVSWRVAKAADELIGPNNGGTGGASKAAGDDGNINWARGKTFSESVKVIPELELSMGDFGAFFRGKVFYDFAVEGDKAEVRPIPEAEKDIAGSGYSLLDAFVWANFAVGEQYLDVRVGQQVVNWGEALFALTGGVNTINPLDGAAATAPGVEIKEIVLPTVMLYATLSLTDTTAVEAFFRPAQFFEQTLAPACGTFFGADYVSTYSEACDYLNVGGASDASNLSGPYTGGSDPRSAVIPRTLGNAHAHKDEFGLAYRFAIEAIDTEFGVYYVQYNNTSPSFYLTAAAVAPAVDLTATTPITPRPFSAGYGLKYVEGLEMFGISASTQKAKISWQWELSYRPDAYLSFGEEGLLNQTLMGAMIPGNTAGGPVPAHEEGDLYQMSLTATKVLGQMLGAGSGAFVLEATVVNADFNPDKMIPIVLLAPATHPLLGPLPTGTPVASVCAYCPATRTSWGYTALFSLSYYNVVAGVNMKPSVTFTHNVNGTSGIGAGSFREGRRNISATLAFDYRTVHGIKLKYTDYIASDDPTGTDNYDKDFMSLTYSWSL